MATNKPGNVVRNLSSVRMETELSERMTENIALDPDLRHVSPLRRRGPWLRAAIAEKCERQEKARAGE